MTDKSNLIAVTRAIGEPLEGCELTHLSRKPIDQDLARSQLMRYREKLVKLGADLINLPALEGHPDAVFIEDAAVVLDEIAILARPGAESRRDEPASLLKVLSDFRPVVGIREPGTLDGGDVLRIGRTLYVGASTRTNTSGIDELKCLVDPYDYQVIIVPVDGCLHLKTGCTWIGDQTVIINDQWIDAGPFGEYDLIRVPHDELWAANTLKIGDKVLMATGNSKTRLLVEARGFLADEINISELQKAEAGLTCLSLILQD